MARKKSEPLITRRFTARKGAKIAKGIATVDTGANITNLNRAVACQLVSELPQPDVIAITSGGDTIGNLIEVTVRVGRRSAPIKAYVPAVLYLPGGSTVDIEGHNLIGLNFLRQTKAVLDFNRRPGRELQGWQEWNPRLGNIIRFRKPTKREAALAAHRRCSHKKTPR